MILPHMIGAEIIAAKQPSLVTMQTRFQEGRQPGHRKQAGKGEENVLGDVIPAVWQLARLRMNGRIPQSIWRKGYRETTEMWDEERCDEYVGVSSPMAGRDRPEFQVRQSVFVHLLISQEVGKVLCTG